MGKKDKKIDERSELRGSLKRGKGGAALPPSPGHRLARFFRLFDPVFFLIKMYLLIITLNNYSYNTTKKKNTLTIDINRVKQY